LISAAIAEADPVKGISARDLKRVAASLFKNKTTSEIDEIMGGAAKAGLMIAEKQGKTTRYRGLPSAYASAPEIKSVKAVAQKSNEGNEIGTGDLILLNGGKEDQVWEIVACDSTRIKVNPYGSNTGEEVKWVNRTEVKDLYEIV
jgi:hypothetical protein